jgi:hypothetical protein
VRRPAPAAAIPDRPQSADRERPPEGPLVAVAGRCRASHSRTLLPQTRSRTAAHPASADTPAPSMRRSSRTSPDGDRCSAWIATVRRSWRGTAQGCSCHLLRENGPPVASYEAKAVARYHRLGCRDGRVGGIRRASPVTPASGAIATVSGSQADTPEPRPKHASRRWSLGRLLAHVGGSDSRSENCPSRTRCGSSRKRIGLLDRGSCVSLDATQARSITCALPRRCVRPSRATRRCGLSSVRPLPRRCMGGRGHALARQPRPLSCSGVSWCPDVRGPCARALDDQRFCLEVLLKAVRAELAADPGLLVAAEWSGRVEGGAV